MSFPEDWFKNLVILDVMQRVQDPQQFPEIELEW